MSRPRQTHCFMGHPLKPLGPGRRQICEECSRRKAKEIYRMSRAGAARIRTLLRRGLSVAPADEAGLLAWQREVWAFFAELDADAGHRGPRHLRRLSDGRVGERESA